MADYIPKADAAFDTWQTNYVTAFAANAAALGFDPLVDVPALTAVQTVWNGSYAAHTTAQAAAEEIDLRELSERPLRGGSSRSATIYCGGQADTI